MTTSASYDIVIPFWAKSQCWPLIRCGLEANAAAINEVFVVIDGPRDGQDFPCTNVTINVLDFPTRPPEPFFGAARAINAGITAATTDFVLVSDADVFLMPNVLSGLVPLSRLVALGFDGIDKDDLDSSNYPNIPAKYPDPRQKLLIAPENLNGFRGGLFLVHRRAFLDLGGWNERMTQYGLQDWEFAARWRAKYRIIDYIPGQFGIHIGGHNTPEEAAAKTPPLANHIAFAQARAECFYHRYNLACGDRPDPSCLNVDNHPSNAAHADVMLDCAIPTWIPDASATLIKSEHFIEHLPYDVAEAHLTCVASKLAPGGELFLAWPDLKACCEGVLRAFNTDDTDLLDRAKRGLFSAPEGITTNPGNIHRWGWSREELKDILCVQGLEIERCGPDDRMAHRIWRDSLIIARKPKEIA